ncbi:hypothetical protein ACSQ67_025469 [Phaseolus vulgaris]
MISVQVATLPIGCFMEKVLPGTKVRIRGREFSLNPGPFNTKEHVLISILVNAGSAFGSGSVYAVGIVDIIRVFYGRRITLLSRLAMVMDVGVKVWMARIMKKYVVEPAEMWWPSMPFMCMMSPARSIREQSCFEYAAKWALNRSNGVQWKFWFGSKLVELMEGEGFLQGARCNIGL